MTNSLIIFFTSALCILFIICWDSDEGCFIKTGKNKHDMGVIQKFPINHDTYYKYL